MILQSVQQARHAVRYASVDWWKGEGWPAWKVGLAIGAAAGAVALAVVLIDGEDRVHGTVTVPLP